MYQYNNPQNNDSPLPSARMPARPRFNTGEEYSMTQTSYNGGSNGGSTPGYQQDNTLGYYESSIPGTNNMQQPLLGTPNGSSMTSSVAPNGGGGARFGNSTSNMIGGGPGDFGIAPRRQTRRFKTSK
jgi:chitin synthase